jgi:outer membrane protein insertion porin family
MRRLFVVMLATGLFVCAPDRSGADEAVEAAVTDFLGRPIVDVQVQIVGEPVRDPAVLAAVETRVGERLSMDRVRKTLDHLVGLGRFEDVRVFAEAAAGEPPGVRLRWELVPVQRIVEIDVVGRPEFSDTQIRSALSERHGATPSTARVEEMIGTLRTFYAERGYASPMITPRVVSRAPIENAELVLTIEAGRRTTIADIAVVGTPNEPTPAILSSLGLRVGGPYDRQELERRADAYEEKLRERGYYEVAVDHHIEMQPDGASARLTLDIQPGPLVRVVFAGDPLPGERSNELVRIREERSVDEDLLEDAGRNIAAYLRERGYREASVAYSRAEQGGELTVTFTVTRGPLHRVSAVEVGGSDSIDSATLQPLLQLKEGEPFVDIRVAAVASAITELYHVRGFTGVVVKPEVTALPVAIVDDIPLRPVLVRFQVTEGGQSTVTSVTIEGASTIPEAQIRAALALTAGRPFYRPQLDADRDAIERAYRNHGFQNASIQGTTNVSPDGGEVSVVWSIREGEQTFVDHVLVKGSSNISLDVINREVLLKPGQPLGDDAIVESQRRLSALGMFRRVRITQLPRSTGGARDVLVELEEAPSTTISYGGGIEVVPRLRPEGETGEATERLEVAPRGFFQVSRRNLWGKNRSATLFTRVSLRSRDPAVDSTDPTDMGGYGFNEYRFVGTFREPRVFETAGDVQFTGFLERAIRPSFTFNRRGVRGEYARRAKELYTLSGRYTLDRTRLSDEQIEPDDQLLIDRLFPQVRLSTFTGSVLRDSRDDVLDPTRGAMMSVEGSLAARAVGSEVGFAKSLLQGFVYHKVSSSPRAVTLVAGARAGIARGFEREVPKVDDAGDPVIGDDGQQVVQVVSEVPASERFFAGGDTTVRGFAQDLLGTDETLNDQGFPSGGNGLLVLNVEVRSAYWKGLGVVGFFDAGNVFEKASDVEFDELRTAAGFGLRYRSPLGPLRVDLGFKLDRRVLRSGSRERLAILHISLGQAF